VSNARAVVENWVYETEGLLEAILKQAIQNLVIEMQTTHYNGGFNRIDQGWHIASFQINLNGEPQAPTRVAPEGAAPGWAVNEVALILDGLSLGDTVVGSYGMIYSNRLEYGFTGIDSLGRTYNTPAYGFVRMAAQNWPAIVAAVQNEVRPG
jgi:hypothetical protein